MGPCCPGSSERHGGIWKTMVTRARSDLPSRPARVELDAADSEPHAKKSKPAGGAANPPDAEIPGFIYSNDDDELGPRVKRSRIENEDDVADIVSPEKDEEGDAINSNCNALISAGYPEAQAKTKATDIVSPTQATFMELYGRGGIANEAKHNGSSRNLNV